MSRNISGSALALELPFTLVGPIAVAAAIGYFLDLRLHTKPWLTIVGILFGLAAALKGAIDLLKSASGD